jgi:hypothetical protein
MASRPDDLTAEGKREAMAAILGRVMSEVKSERLNDRKTNKKRVF